MVIKISHTLVYVLVGTQPAMIPAVQNCSDITNSTQAQQTWNPRCFFYDNVTLYTNALTILYILSTCLTHCCYRVNRLCLFRCPRSSFPSPSHLTMITDGTRRCNWDDLGKNNFLRHLSCAGVLGGLLILGSVLVNSVAPLFVPKNRYKTVQFSRN